jgi:hypothetical protein
MTIDELVVLRRRGARRVAESQPFSPEWDAAMAAVDDLSQLQANVNDRDGPDRQRSRQADPGWQRGES